MLSSLTKLCRLKSALHAANAKQSPCSQGMFRQDTWRPLDYCRVSTVVRLASGHKLMPGTLHACMPKHHTAIQRQQAVMQQ